MKFDVVAFGSASYDIYLMSDEFLLQKTQEGIMLCERYGKKITIQNCVTTTGGGATNAAVCFERMGLQSGVITCLGRDHWGSIVRAKLKEEGVSLVHLQSTSKEKTNSSVALVGSDGGRSILVYRAAGSLLSHRQVAWSKLNASWFYLSSLGGDFAMLEKIIKTASKKGIKIAFNPGSKELKQGSKIKKYLSQIEVLLMNKQEALTLFGQKSKTQVDHGKVLALRAKLVVITDGRKGAMVFTQDGKIIIQKAIKTKAVEETGAGDAFGSGFVAGQIHNLDLEKSLKLAALNASSVVKHIGPKKGLLFWPEAKSKLKLSA